MVEQDRAVEMGHGIPGREGGKGRRGGRRKGGEGGGEYKETMWEHQEDLP